MTAGLVTALKALPQVRGGGSARRRGSRWRRPRSSTASIASAGLEPDGGPDLRPLLTVDAGPPRTLPSRFCGVLGLSADPHPQFSPDHQTLTVLGHGRLLEVRTSDGAPAQSELLALPISAAAVAPDRATFATLYPTVALRSIPDGKVLLQLPSATGDREDPIYVEAAYSPDGHFLAFVSVHSGIDLVDVAAHAVQEHLTVPPDGNYSGVLGDAHHVMFSRDSSTHRPRRLRGGIAAGKRPARGQQYVVESPG
jgi:hypothetical protein